VSVSISPQISAANGASGRGPAGWLAALEVTDLEQRTARHEVADPSCSSLVHALGLLVALRADAAPAARPPAELAAPGPAGVGEPAAPVDAPSDPKRRGPAALRVGAVVSANARSALAPEVALGFGLGVALEWAGEGAWAPRLELSLSQLESSALQLPGEAAMQFEALLVSASACPVRLLGTPDVSLRPCVDLEVGKLTGEGSGLAVSGAEPRRAPWLGAGLSLRAHLRPWGGPVQLGAALGASLPLYRHEFFFAPDIQGFEVPLVGWNGAGTLAWLF
jgi:hypothetical protein